MTAAELTKARALYIGHMLARGICYFVIFLFSYELFGFEKSSGEWFLFLVYLLATFFIVDLVLNPLFKRKSRAWQLRLTRPEEDRWPRR